MKIGVDGRKWKSFLKKKNQKANEEFVGQGD
jgi:hypothetical protein